MVLLDGEIGSGVGCCCVVVVVCFAFRVPHPSSCSPLDGRNDNDGPSRKLGLSFLTTLLGDVCGGHSWWFFFL